MYFSIIIPVFNRPEEIKELLESMTHSTFKQPFEVVIVEDGSTINCKSVVESFKDKLSVSYYYKENSGPGDSRNFGMQVAKGDYFIIFDSDCIIPPQYLNEVYNELKGKYVDFFGGPDAALASFSKIQKAINFTMTSFLTTGGIRGGSEKLDKFQPRSFNMGISKKAFLASHGFGNIHPGEDPDLTIRLWKQGFTSRLFPKAFVYHKRRIDWDKFSVQVNKFGKARPILNYWHPEYKKLTYWFPSFFALGIVFSILAIFLFFDWKYNDAFLKLYFAYFALIFIVSSIVNKNPIIGFYSIIATWKQFFGYGFGFLYSFFKINILKQKPEKVFPQLFFTKIITKPESSNTTAIEAKNNTENKNHQTVFSKTKIIGLTGGIGAGKSTVAQYLKSLGIPVYISDFEAKKIMEHPKVIEKINQTFGEKFNSDKGLNREKLASIVFSNPEKLKQLNAIVHPIVKKHFENWVNSNRQSPWVVKEAAILFESGSYKDCDYIITVTAPLETRIARVIKRDGTSKEKILQRIKNQISDEERIAKSNFVVENIDIETTKKQIDSILKKMKS